VAKVEEIEAGHRRLGHVGLEFGRGEHAGPRAVLPRSDEFANNPFRFAEHLEVGCTIDMGARSGIGAADDDRLLVRVAKVDQPQRVGLLRQHSAGENQIGPGHIVARDRLGIAVDEARRPAGRQHRGDGDQPKRRRRTANSHKIARFSKAPERVRDEERIKHEYVAGSRRVHGYSPRRFPVHLGTSHFILQPPA